MSLIYSTRFKADNNFKFSSIPGFDQETHQINIPAFFMSDEVQNLMKNKAEFAHLTPEHFDVNSDKFTYNQKPESITENDIDQATMYYMGIFGTYIKDYKTQDYNPKTWTYITENGEFVHQGNYSPNVSNLVATLAELNPGTTFYGINSVAGEYSTYKLNSENGEINSYHTPWIDVQDPEPKPFSPEEEALRNEVFTKLDTLNNLDDPTTTSKSKELVEPLPDI